MTIKAKIMYRDRLAGILEKYDNGYRFSYDPDYLKLEDAMPISLSIPLQEYPFTNRTLFPFFDGLIPEGWLLDIAKTHWKMKGTDRFQLLITLCRDTIGAVTVYPMEEEENA